MREERSSPSVEVGCAVCHRTFELSVRNELRHRRRGVPHLCQWCRLPGTRPSRKADEKLKAWWLERFSLDELRSWPPI